MKKYNVILMTHCNRHIQVEATSEQDAQDQLDSLTANQVEELTRDVPCEYTEEYEVDIIDEV